MKVLSLGCGPCLDGFSLKEKDWFKSYVASYTGVDYTDWDNEFCFRFQNSKFVKNDVIDYLEKRDWIDENVIIFPQFLPELSDDKVERLKKTLSKLKADDIRIVASYRVAPGKEIDENGNIRYNNRKYVVEKDIERIKNIIDYLQNDIENPYTYKQEYEGKGHDDIKYLWEREFYYCDYPESIYDSHESMFGKKPMASDFYAHYFVYTLKRNSNDHQCK